MCHSHMRLFMMTAIAVDKDYCEIPSHGDLSTTLLIFPALTKDQNIAAGTLMD